MQLFFKVGSKGWKRWINGTKIAHLMYVMTEKKGWKLVEATIDTEGGKTTMIPCGKDEAVTVQFSYQGWEMTEDEMNALEG